MNSKRITKIAIFSALTIVLSQFSIPIGPVPISLGILAVFICGIILEPKDAVLSQIVYLLIGAIGIPVFANFQGGVGALIGYTGGFLISYPFVALITSLAATKFENRFIILPFMLLSLLVCYTLGTLWFSNVAGTSINDALSLTVIPFIIGDIIKIAITIILIYPLRQKILNI